MQDLTQFVMQNDQETPDFIQLLVNSGELRKIFLLKENHFLMNSEERKTFKEC